MFEWFESNQTLVYWLTGASVVMFVGTMVATPIVLVRLPADYFEEEKRQDAGRKSHPVLRVFKNVLGAVLLLAGLAMLLLPGQGLLCVLLGVILMDFPGKYRVQRWILGRKKVLGAINWMRKKAGKEPMKIDKDSEGGKD